MSQWMTLSNRLGIKLMTTKTFPALKPIYTLALVSLMSALKSTTNSPRRKSRAHRGCSGCLILCVRIQVPTHACVGACGRKRARTCSVSVMHSVMTNRLFMFCARLVGLLLFGCLSAVTLVMFCRIFLLKKVCLLLFWKDCLSIMPPLPVFQV